LGLFRRRPLHERLLAEGDDGSFEPRPVETQPLGSLGPNLDSAGIHGVSRRRQWDAVVTATAPGVKGAAVRFVAVASGDLLVEEGDDVGDLGPIADAVESQLDRPYRVEAVRQHGDVFAAGARRLALATLPDAKGESLMLTVRDGARELEVDGDRTFGGMPALELLGERVGRDYVVRAERLDGPLFEVRADAL
jgi:hypothetical protein